MLATINVIYEFRYTPHTHTHTHDHTHTHTHTHIHTHRPIICTCREMTTHTHIHKASFHYVIAQGDCYNIPKRYAMMSLQTTIETGSTNQYSPSNTFCTARYACETTMSKVMWVQPNWGKGEGR